SCGTWRRSPPTSCRSSPWGCAASGPRPRTRPVRRSWPPVWSTGISTKPPCSTTSCTAEPAPDSRKTRRTSPAPTSTTAWPSMRSTSSCGSSRATGSWSPRATMFDPARRRDVQSSSAMQPARQDAPPAPVTASRKVLFVEGSAGGVVGGSLTGILELLPYLDRRRYDPALVLAEPKPGLELAGTAIHVLAPRADAGPISAGSSLVRTLRRGVQVFSVVLPRAQELMALFARERPSLVY